MKGKLTAIIAGTMLAITGATLPASAIVSGTGGEQPLAGRQTETILLAANKKSKPPAAKKDNTVKGGHSTGKSPSNKAKHEKGEAQRNQDQNVNPAFKKYKANGGKLAKDAWLKAGSPKK